VKEANTSIRADARTRRNRTALRQALLELLQTRPFDKITVREIAAKAGIGYATFFRHYLTKAHSLEDLAAHEVQRLIDRSAEALDYEDPRSLALALCRYVHDHRVIWSALFNGGAASLMRQEYIRIASELGEAQSHSSTWLPPELAAIHNASTNLELMAWWLRQPELLPIAQMAEIVDKLVITPVLMAANDVPCRSDEV
jgi:AcrR family transcriptional regulator